MSSLTLDESTLAVLIDRLTPGEEVRILRNGQPVATLKVTPIELQSTPFTAWADTGSTLELHSPIFAAEAAAQLQQLLEA